MIRYKKGNFRLTNLLRVRGSVFPQSLHLAFWCGAMSAAFKIMEMHKWYGADLFFANVLNNNSAYSSFSVLIGFLVIFRTQQAYSRFWDSCKYVKTMQAEFFVTGANLVAFCRHPDTNKQSESVEVLHFQHVLIRLLSLLHAVCLMQLHGKESTIHPEVIDPHGLDLESLIAIGNEECKVELLVQWVQCLTVDGIQTGVCTIPAPILSRIFQNLSNGLAAFYNAYRVTEVPYPFPYMQSTEVLLLAHYIVTPMVICNFTISPGWSFIFSFLVVFTLLSLNRIACELEDPFGTDPNDLDMDEMQGEMNKRLLLLMKPSSGRLPVLSELAQLEWNNAREAANAKFPVTAKHITTRLSHVLTHMRETTTECSIGSLALARKTRAVGSEVSRKVTGQLSNSENLQPLLSMTSETRIGLAPTFECEEDDSTGQGCDPDPSGEEQKEERNMDSEIDETIVAIRPSGFCRSTSALGAAIVTIAEGTKDDALPSDSSPPTDSSSSATGDGAAATIWSPPPLPPQRAILAPSLSPSLAAAPPCEQAIAAVPAPEHLPLLGRSFPPARERLPGGGDCTRASADAITLTAAIREVQQASTRGVFDGGALGDRAPYDGGRTSAPSTVTGPRLTCAASDLETEQDQSSGVSVHWPTLDDAHAASLGGGSDGVWLENVAQRSVALGLRSRASGPMWRAGDAARRRQVDEQEDGDGDDEERRPRLGRFGRVGPSASPGVRPRAWKRRGPKVVKKTCAHPDVDPGESGGVV